MCLTAVICLLWAWDYFCVGPRFWLPCHISKTSWTLAFLGTLLSSASFYISKLFSVFSVSNAASSPGEIALLAKAICHTTTVSRRVYPVVFHCLQPMTARPREKLASALTSGGTIQHMSRAALVSAAYFQCVSFRWRHQSVMSGIQNVLLISIGLEW